MPERSHPTIAPYLNYTPRVNIALVGLEVAVSIGPVCAIPVRHLMQVLQPRI